MKNLSVTIISLLFASILGAVEIRPTDNGLTLRIETKVIIGGSQPTDGSAPKTLYRLEYYPILSNTGKKAVTVPTQLKNNEKATGWYSPPKKERGISYWYAIEEFNETKMIYSPYLYAPVTLEPGDSTMLPALKITTSNPKGEDTIYFHYEIEKPISKRNDWWRGSITAKAEFKQK